MQELDTEDASPEGTGGSLWRRTAALLTVLTVLGIIASATVGCLAFAARARHALSYELSLSQATMSVDSYRYYGQSFAEGAAMGTSAQVTQAGLTHTAEHELAALAGLSRRARPLMALNDRLRTAMDRELALVSAGRRHAAQRLDATRTSVAFRALSAKLSALRPALARRAKDANAASRAATIATMLGAAVLVIGILGVFERARRRAHAERAKAALLERHRRLFSALLRNGSDLIVVVGPDGMITFEAPSASGVLGYAPQGLVGRRAEDLVHPDDAAQLQRLCARLAERGDVRMRHADGCDRVFDVRATFLPRESGIEGTVLNGREVTDHRHLEDALRHQAFHDSLTGLANRALFLERVDAALARRRGTHVPAMLLIDLDDFKSVNDGLGHGSGNALLVEVAACLRSLANREAVVARLGGDEFAMLVEKSSPEQATRLAEAVVACLSQPMAIGDGTERENRTQPRLGAHVQGDPDDEISWVTVGASVGIAFADASVEKAGDLLRNADVAMYVAKRSGKARAVRFEEAMRRDVHARLELKRDLVAALDEADQLFLEYQPIVRLETGEPVAVEALVRWHHPRRGLLRPASFVPLAEETGLIVPLGRFVLREATAQLARWHAEHPELRRLRVGVNVSTLQLADDGFVAEVHAALDRAGLQPTALTIELTESAVLESARSVCDGLEALRAVGTHLAIDDFGTGYSSLGYLQRLPVDLLKIDQTFTADLLDKERQRSLTEAIARIASTLGLMTVAEGIESPAQAELLRSLSCEFGQGYHYAPPLSPAECGALLLSWIPAARTAGA